MENTAHFPIYLRKSDASPVPLTHNFYETTLYQSTADDTASTSSRNSATSDRASEKIVRHLMQISEKEINRAALQTAASKTLQVNTQQFQNLIPLSFDHEQFIREREAEMRRK